MAFGFHTRLQSSLTETIEGVYSDYGSRCLQCYIGSSAFTSADLQSAKQLISQTRFKLYTHSCLAMNLASGSAINVVKLQKELHPILATGGSTVVHIGSQNVNKQPIGTLDNVIATLRKLDVKKREGLQPYPILAECAAGEGSKFGSSLSDLEYLFDNLKDTGIGFCLDTAHSFSAGVFNFETEENILDMFDVIDEVVGKGRFVLMHLNDSATRFGGCSDRHANLGKGYIWEDGLDSCRFLLKECQRRGIDVVLETPNGSEIDYPVGCELLA